VIKCKRNVRVSVANNSLDSTDSACESNWKFFIWWFMLLFMVDSFRKCVDVFFVLSQRLSIIMILFCTCLCLVTILRGPQKDATVIFTQTSAKVDWFWLLFYLLLHFVVNCRRCWNRWSRFISYLFPACYLWNLNGYWPIVCTDIIFLICISIRIISAMSVRNFGFCVDKLARILLNWITGCNVM